MNLFGSLLEFALGEGPAVVEEVVVPVAVQGDGDPLRGSQFRAKRSKIEDDPRSAIERLIDRFKAAHAPKAVKAVVKAAARATETVIEPIAPKVAPALIFEWQAALDELRESEQRQADLLRVIEALEAIRQQAREAEEEEEAVMLLLAA